MHGISRALEIGRFTISRSVSREAHITLAFGLFKCLYDYCCETRTYDVFAVTNPETMKKYGMAGVNIIGAPFRYSKPLTGGLWVPVHANIRAAQEGYKNYLAHGQITVEKT